MSRTQTAKNGLQHGSAGSAHGLLSSSFLRLPYRKQKTTKRELLRILNTNHKEGTT